MASLVIEVGEENHVTLFHFEKMDQEKYDKIIEILTPLIHQIRFEPSGRFGKKLLVGQFRNVRAYQLVSPYVENLYGHIHQLFETWDIVFSENFEFNPHVSHPQPGWEEGMLAPIEPWLSLVWKGHDSTWLQLGDFPVE